MSTTHSLRFGTVVIALSSLGLLVCAGLNLQQRSQYQLPYDGVSWIDTQQGVTAWVVSHNSPSDQAGIHKGDILVSIDGKPIHKADEAAQAIFQNGVWSDVVYNLTRQGEEYQTSVLISPQPQPRTLRDYLEVVGLLYLLIGAFVLIRRSSARKSLHFYLFCFSSFVLFTFSYSGKLNAFDWTVYWLNVAAWILQPTLFLHFCLTFPARAQWLRRRSYGAALLYVPALILGIVHVAVALQAMVLPVPLAASNWLLDRVELFYMLACFLAGTVVLLRSGRRAEVPLVQQQLKWLIRGTVVAMAPFALLYGLPYGFGYVPLWWMNLSVMSLVLLPLTFGYSIMQYRLMDVDIIFRRGLAYTLATATIVGLYIGGVALFADFFRNHLVITSHGGWIIAIVLTAVLFQPLLNAIQSRLDRFFNPERYDYRATLLDFARQLASEVRLDCLLDEVSKRLTSTLSVDRLAFFLTGESGELTLAKSTGLPPFRKLDLSFLDPSRAELAKGYLFFDSVRRVPGVSGAAQSAIERLDLHYYLPLKVKERTLGYLGLGKTREGDFLSREDVDLLHTLAGYVGIAVENAQLYQSLEQKARQYEALKDFNENIIESISAGVMATNLGQEIEAWNSAMEKLYGVNRSAALGKKLDEVFSADLIRELPTPSDSRPDASLYKFRLNNATGQQLIVNISLAPLVGKDGQVLGRLMIVNDLTDRVNLEDQLAQAEKLSSIGLLAAGVAHEVNTPLAVITSQAQMLLRQLQQAPLDGSQMPTLEKIVKSSFRASEIVNSLLKFSRVSGSELSEMDLNRVIRETLSLVDPMLRASHISLNLQLAGGVPPIYGNYGKLQQVFMNLIMNARDAMPRGGELTVATDREDSMVRAEVSDNGVGIPAEHLAKIFDPFFTTKASSRGTGLGLAVTYGLMREHSGKIWVDSNVGRGTTFRLEFPVARRAVNVS